MNDFNIQIRINNVVYKCELCTNWFNAKKKQAYSVAVIIGTEPKEAGQHVMMMRSGIICEDCYKTSEIGFEEPSGIVLEKGPLPKMKNHR